MAYLKKCFFITPLRRPLSHYRMRASFLFDKIIKPVLEECGYECSHAASRPSTMILKQLIRDILGCDLVIADLTSGNPNVFYELAFAQTIGKPSIQMIDRKEGRIPFDVREQYTIKYEYPVRRASYIDEVKEKLKKQVEMVRKEPCNVDSPILSFVKQIDLVASVIESMNDKVISIHEPEIHDMHDEITDRVHGRPRLKLICKDFGEYCRQCGIMITKAERKQGVITVQTPVEFEKDDDDDKAYEAYINLTIDNIINGPKLVYRRLTLVNGGVKTARKRIKEFLKKLLLKADDKQCESLQNVWIGFLRVDKAMDTAYTNMDFLVSDNDFALAFLANKKRFGKSLHIFDKEKIISQEVMRDIIGLWDNRKNIRINLTKDFYSPDITLADARKRLFAKVDNVFAKL